MNVPAAAQPSMTSTYNPTTIRHDIVDVYNDFLDKVDPDLIQTMFELYVTNPENCDNLFENTAVSKLRVKYHTGNPEQQVMINDLFAETIAKLNGMPLDEATQKRIKELDETIDPMNLPLEYAMEKYNQLDLGTILSMPTPAELKAIAEAHEAKAKETN